MSVQLLLQPVLIIFLMIFVGYLTVRCRVVPADAGKIFSNLIMSVTLPCTLIASTGIAVGPDAVILMAKAFLIQLIFYMVSAALCQIPAGLMKMPDSKRAVFVAAAVMPNCAFIGMPLCSALIGSEESAMYGASAIMAYNVFFFTYVAALFQGRGQFRVKKLITPTTAATLAMVLLFLTGIRLPEMLMSFVSSVGACTTPLALMVIGIMLAGSDIRQVFKEKFFYGTTLLRNFLLPILLLLVLSRSGWEPAMWKSIVILCGCPSASLAAVLARQYDKCPELCSQAVVHSTVFMIVSIPLLLFLIGAAAG